MSTLYVANCTRQNHDFNYRVPDTEPGSFRRMQTQRIAPGTQQKIHTEAPLAVLEAIVNQHRQYGLIPVEEVVRTKAFIGLCYSFDRPVDFERMSYAAERNQGVLQEQGEKMRIESAIAVAPVIDASLPPDLPRPDAVAIEVVEEGDNPKLGAGVEVTAEADPSKATSGQRERGQRRR